MSGHRYDQMFENNQAFKPARGYGVPDYRPPESRLQYKVDLMFEMDIFANLITAEYKFRQTLQRMENLKENIRALEKVPEDLEDFEEKKQLQQYHEQLETVKREHRKNEQTLFAEESMLPPGPLKQDYDATRQDPTWYLRKQLVEDCIGRGGCCARDCDCCEDRAPAQFKKGVGHCTAGCGCCASERGFEHTAEEVQEAVDQLDSMLRSRNPSYVIKMAEAYFVKPRQGEKVEKKKEREKKAREEKAWEERVQREKAQAQAEAQARAKKAQAEKAQAEKAQAEKAQAEKAQAEKAQAEKAQAEKAQAEKAQAEKAQTEKGAEVKVQEIEVQEEKGQKKKVHWWKQIF